MSLSTFLNGRESTTLRGLMWLSLSESGSVVTLASTSDSGGGASQVWTAGTAVPCRLDPLSATDSVTGGQIDERSTHLVTVAAGVAVSTSDRFSVSNRGTFEVTAVREQTAEQAHFFEVIQIS